MPDPPTQRPLNPREREVLRDIILMYILSAEPVSSRAISKHGGLGLSAATIRNIMADLEDAGYLRQPHTSAGRVPTGAGYHLFAESLMGPHTVPARVRRYIDEHLREAPADAEGLVEVTSHLLSELSQQVGIVVTPAIGDTVLRAIDFVPLSGSRVLVVVVSESGFVDNKVIDTERPLPREELVRASNYLTHNFGGKTLRQIRDRLLALMAEERTQVDQLLGSALDLARRSLDLVAEREVLVDGTSALLAHPELLRRAAGPPPDRDLRRQGAPGANAQRLRLGRGGAGDHRRGQRPDVGARLQPGGDALRGRGAGAGDPGDLRTLPDGISAGDPSGSLPGRDLERGPRGGVDRARMTGRNEG